MHATVLFDDHPGSPIDDPDDGDLELELRCYDASVEPTGETFNLHQVVVADAVEPYRCSTVPNDAVQFPAALRDANAIRRLHEATAYSAPRAEARAWRLS